MVRFLEIVIVYVIYNFSAIVNINFLKSRMTADKINRFGKENMLKITNVTKKYRRFCALDDISFELEEGVYGLIGENGAGKTTIMKILTRQITADNGKILYGQAEWNDECKTKVGYLPQNFEFFDNLTVMEAIRYLLQVRGENPDEQKNEIIRWLEYLNLTAYSSKKIKKLSGGMRQRLGILQAFLGDPEIVLLDEPTVGLDPKERLAFRNMINEVCDNKTILVSTHILDDVESTCEKMISLKQGRIIYEGKINAFVGAEQGKVYTTSLKRTDIPQIGNEISIIAIKREEDMIHIRFMINNMELFKSIELYQNAQIRKVDTTLEDAYFLHTYLMVGK